MGNRPSCLFAVWKAYYDLRMRLPPCWRVSWTTWSREGRRFLRQSQDEMQLKSQFSGRCHEGGRGIFVQQISKPIIPVVRLASIKRHTSLADSTQSCLCFYLRLFVKFEAMRVEVKLNHFALRSKLYPKALQASFDELGRLKTISGLAQGELLS